MNAFLKMLGLVLVLAGVVCLVIYSTATPTNSLLVTGLVLEVIGILSFILFNKKED